MSAALPCHSKHNINNFMPSQSDRNFPGLYWGEFNSMNAFVVGLAMVDAGDFFCWRRTRLVVERFVNSLWYPNNAHMDLIYDGF